VAGCWFSIRDGSGTIKVDTKTAGFVVVDVPVGAQMTVGGAASREGAEPVVQGTGISY
jgi:hypothetical protein